MAQCPATTRVVTKFADTTPQPRCAAILTPKLSTLRAVMAIGGCGRWNGTGMVPTPNSGITASMMRALQVGPLMS